MLSGVTLQEREAARLAIYFNDDTFTDERFRSAIPAGSGDPRGDTTATFQSFTASTGERLNQEFQALSEFSVAELGNDRIDSATFVFDIYRA